MTRRALVPLALGVWILMLFPAVVQAKHGKGHKEPPVESPPTLTALSIGQRDSAQPSSSGTGGVIISATAPAGGLTVSLSSSDPSALQVPASVSIPAGADNAEFSYTTGAVASGTSVTLTATLGTSSLQAAVVITALELESLLTDPEIVEGGKEDAIIPDLSGPAPSEGALVSLKSSSQLVPLPESVTIPAGSFLEPVDVTTGAVSAVTNVELSASYSGLTVSHVLTLTPPEAPTSLTLNPTTAVGTDGAVGTVGVSYTALEDFPTVALSSSDPSVAQIAGPAQIQPGESSANFQITTAEVSSPTNVTITATGDGTSVSAVLTVDPPAPVQSELQLVTVSPGSVTGGSSATGTATLNQAAPAGGAVVELVTSNSRVATVPASVTIPAGATSATFPVKTVRPHQSTDVAVGGAYGRGGEQGQRSALLGVTGKKGSVLPEPAPGVFAGFSGAEIPEGHFDQGIQNCIEGTLEAFTQTVVSGALPPGMELVPRPLCYLIDGTPPTQGLYAFVIKATNSNNTVTFAFPDVIKVGPPEPLEISKCNFFDGTVGKAYEGGCFFGGGVAPYKWSVSAGALPPGLKLNTTTSEVSGTPTTAGTFSFTLRVTDSKGVTTEASITLTIAS
jgi:hypothetical protein